MNPLKSKTSEQHPPQAAFGVAGNLSPAQGAAALRSIAEDRVGGPALARAVTRLNAARQSAKGALAPTAQEPAIAKTRAARIPNAAFAAILAALPKRAAAKSTAYTLPFADIANSLGLPYRTALSVFSNGRAFSQIGEEHAAILMGFDLHEHKDKPGTDGFRVDPSTGDKLLVSVKSAARTSVKFQLSVYSGAGRACTEQLLLDSIEQAATIVVVDVRHLPEVRITEFPAQCAVDWVRAKILTPAGMSAERFYLACGASCSSVNLGAHDFSRELEALALANAAAEKAHLAAQAQAPANPFIPSAAFLASAVPKPPKASKAGTPGPQAPRAPSAAPAALPGVVGSPLRDRKPSVSRHH